MTRLLARATTCLITGNACTDTHSPSRPSTSLWVHGMRKSLTVILCRHQLVERRNHLVEHIREQRRHTAR